MSLMTKQEFIKRCQNQLPPGGNIKEIIYTDTTPYNYTCAAAICEDTEGDTLYFLIDNYSTGFKYMTWSNPTGYMNWNSLDSEEKEKLRKQLIENVVIRQNAIIDVYPIIENSAVQNRERDFLKQFCYTFNLNTACLKESYEYD